MDVIPLKIIRLPYWLLLITLGISLMSNLLSWTINIRRVLPGYNSTLDLIKKTEAMIESGIMVLPVDRENMFGNFGTTLRLVNKSDGSSYYITVSLKNGFFHFTPNTTSDTETSTSSPDRDQGWVDPLTGSIEDLRLRLNTQRAAINKMAEQYSNTKSSLEIVIDSIQNSVNEKNAIVNTWNLIQVSDHVVTSFGRTVDDLQGPYKDLKDNFSELADKIKMVVQG